MFSIKEIEAFYWTARLRTIQNAALKLSVTQSALSKRIQKLQEFTPEPLFIRQGSRLLLTNHGDAIFRHAQRVLTSLATLDDMKSASHKLRRTLRIGVTELTALTWFGSFVKELRSEERRVGKGCVSRCRS